MRSLRIVGGWWLIACLAPLGCSALPLLPHLAHPDRTEVSPPGEDGTRYVMVEGGRFSSPRALERRWRATVRRTCDGESQEVSEAGYARRQGGIVRRRVHEGYVRCLLPDGAEPSTSPDAPTVADARASTPASGTPTRAPAAATRGTTRSAPAADGGSLRRRRPTRPRPMGRR